MRVFFCAVATLLCTASCKAQTVSNTDTNRDGSLALFDNRKENKSVYVTRQGNVGIGLKNPKDRLEVNGQIHARSVKIDVKNWADFVFDKEYHLPALEDIEAYIDKNGHLPNIPSEKEVKENGIQLGHMQELLLQKIEELTLYTIAQNKEIQTLKEQVIKLQSAQE